MVLGCGSIGYNVIEELESETRSILVVDKDEKRVKDLLDQNYDAVTGDIKNPALFDTLRVPKVAFVLSNEKDANLAAVQAIKARFPEAEVIARAMDPLSQSALEAAGAEYVIYPQEVVAKAAVHQIRRLHVTRIAQRLYALLESWEGVLGIVTHNNPDPDAISSAMALAAIARAASDRRLQTRILYDGNIGHQENRAFVNLLDIRMEKCTAQQLKECRYLAMVDASAPGVNNTIPRGTPVNIVIDHHRAEDEAVAAADFVDIRPGMGATASILTQYLQDLDVPVDKKVATGLLYGIRADTRDFRRNVTPQDLNYVAFLMPLADNDLLDKIMSPSLSKETLDVLGKAIQNRVIRSGYLFSNVGLHPEPGRTPPGRRLPAQSRGREHGPDLRDRRHGDHPDRPIAGRPDQPRDRPRRGLRRDRGRGRPPEHGRGRDPALVLLDGRRQGETPLARDRPDPETVREYRRPREERGAQ